MLANLPYTDSAVDAAAAPRGGLFQPGVALWAGPDSLGPIRRLIGQAPERRPRWRFEHAPHHTRAMHELLGGARTLRDARGDERVTVGRVP